MKNGAFGGAGILGWSVPGQIAAGALLAFGMALHPWNVEAGDFEERQGRKLFEEAERHARQNQPDLALLSYAEIVEFFPGCALWDEACLKMSSLHLLYRNPAASEEFLTRLRAHAGTDPERRRAALAAYWDFFLKQQKPQLLGVWLERCSGEELALLRARAELAKELVQITHGTTFPVLLELCRQLGFEKPLLQAIQVCESGEIHEDLRGQTLILRLALETGDPTLLKRSLARMANSGLHLEAHRVLEELPRERRDTALHGLWLGLLLDGRLFEEADELLRRLPKDQFLTERVVVHGGLERWEEARALLSGHEAQLVGQLKFPDLENLALGLSVAPGGKPAAEKLVAALPDSAARSFLEIQLMDRDRPQLIEARLNELAARHPEETAQARIELALLARRQGDWNRCRAMLDEVLASHPQGAVAERARQELLTLELLYGSGGPNAK